ncbi:MAG: hypothetical protein FWC40_07760 [Proteobacteria bacterium]|nr:hypothetical protein [Pseudomonadota bacterium]
MKFGLESIETAIAHDTLAPAYPHILVGGTNGKGQVSAILSNLATLLGHRTGLFTSPHLISFRERIRVDGACIEPADLQRVGSDTLARFGGDPEDAAMASGIVLTYFECCLMMALAHFRDIGIAFGVFEVGLGGRLDATNALSPCLSIITSVSLDHEAYLGYDLASIAREKAGIMRAGRPVILGRDAHDVLMQEASHRKAGPVYALGRDFDWIEDTDGVMFRFGTHCLPMVGAETWHDYQRDNAAVAFCAALVLSDLGLLRGELLPALRRVILATRWVGRMWRCHEASSQRLGVAAITLDGAHNPEGVRRFCQAIGQAPAVPRALIVNSCADKDIARMFSQYLGVFDASAIFVAPVQNPRALHPHAYCTKVGHPVHQACETLHEALGRAAEYAGPDGYLYISGSLYLLGEVLHALGDTSSLDSICCHEKDAQNPFPR